MLIITKKFFILLAEIFIISFNFIFKFFNFIGNIIFRIIHEKMNKMNKKSRNNINTNKPNDTYESEDKISSKEVFFKELSFKEIFSKIKNILFINNDNDNEAIFEQLKNNHNYLDVNKNNILNNNVENNIDNTVYNNIHSDNFTNNVKYGFKDNVKHSIDNLDDVNINNNVYKNTNKYHYNHNSFLQRGFIGILFRENLLEIINIKVVIPIFLIFNKFSYFYLFWL